MGARNGMVIFYQECLHDKIIHEHFQQANFNILGLLQGVESFAMQGESVSYNFVHLAIQELLSAIYLATQLSPNEQIKIFEKHFGQPRFTGIFRYYVAYRKFNTPGIESILIQAVKYPRKTKLVTTQSDEFLLAFQYSTFEYASQPLLLSIIHCLFHAKDDDLYRLLAQKLNQQLNLSGIRLTLADCQSVGVFLTYCNQFRVNIKSCSIGTQECNVLFRQNRSYPLKSLDLNGNSIGVGGAVGFSEAIKTMTYLQELSLGYNSIGIEGAEAIAGAMKSMTNLQMLYLNHNSIGDEGAVALSEAMTTMSNLQWLSLFKNSIGDDGALAISDAMKDMANLQWLSLTNNAISEIGKEALQNAAQLTGTKIHV